LLLVALLLVLRFVLLGPKDGQIFDLAMIGIEAATCRGKVLTFSRA
jgi:hypothetical protein